ncbi:MAG: alpha/beta hydrolase-fold protein [Bacteroidota bacterium]
MKRIIIGFLVLLSCLNSETFSQKQIFPFGIVDTLFSAELSEKRILNIYLPEGYSSESENKYPVIYLLDGSADEDFIHVAGLIQFLNFPWIDILPKSILVGISNVDRRRDFTFPTTIEKDKTANPTSGKSSQFIAFIEKELQPFIEKNYRTNDSKMLIGQSLGGLLATEILFTKTQLFNQYMIISPSLWWDDESLFLKMNQVNFIQKTNIFVGVGKEGEMMEKPAKKLYKSIKKMNNNLIEVNFQFFENKNHATIMHEAVYKAFETFNEENLNK